MSAIQIEHLVNTSDELNLEQKRLLRWGIDRAYGVERRARKEAAVEFKQYKEADVEEL